MLYRVLLLPALACLIGGAPAVEAGDLECFQPAHRLPGIGASRAGLSDEVIERRTAQMIKSQTFAILRDPAAAAGAQRVLGPKLQRLFQSAGRASGVPSSLLAAIAYLESWGNARAQSPSGPRGIMQISAGTARSIGLRIVYRTRYRTATRIRRVRARSGKRVSRRVRVRVPYTVLVRDDRLVPERAVPAAAKYLARLSTRFDGLDWAVFAYHCGESCAAEMRSLTERADGIEAPYTVAKMFFAASPAVNRDLYQAVRRHMNRDYSPTYWFRVMRASELLTRYQKNPGGFRRLAAEYRNSENPAKRAPHRLAVWLAGEGAGGEGVAAALEDTGFYGFRFRGGAEGRASPSALGTLAYIAFETRRLHEAMRVKGERFRPLEVSSLGHGGSACDEASHATGHVFDIDGGSLAPGQREALKFVLDDLGWEGYLGFIPASPGSHILHIGCAPSAREFFESVYREAFGESDAPVVAGGR